MSVQILVLRLQLDDSRNGSKKPKVPIEKLSTGGTAPTLNSDDACKIVPSPPSVTTRSIFSASGPSNPPKKNKNTASRSKFLTYTSSQVKSSQGVLRTWTPNFDTFRDVRTVFVEQSDVGILLPKIPRQRTASAVSFSKPYISPGGGGLTKGAS